MKLSLSKALVIGTLLCTSYYTQAQVQIDQNYTNYSSDTIGTYQNILFREGGFSALFPIPNTNGKEFWTCSDRGVNIDGKNANPSGCQPTYDKIFVFPDYSPKIHRIRISGDSLQIIKTITIKRPDGTNTRGVLNPDGFGSKSEEVASTDTVLDCTNFALKVANKDQWALDSEGLIVDAEGHFWISEENGPTIWKLDSNGVVLKRFTPYASQVGSSSIDIQIDTVFKYRKNNRGFEALAQTPNGKIYTMIQSAILYPNKNAGEDSRLHRILEIDPQTNATKMYAYLNDGTDGSGADKIRKQDRKIGDMTAINDSTFLVLEAGSRGNNDQKKIYLINIKHATPITSGLYNGSTAEELSDSAGLADNNIVPVQKTLFLDLNASGWPIELDKAEGIAIINDSTIAVCNDNDFGQTSPNEDGIATATNISSHLITFSLKGVNKIPGYTNPAPTSIKGSDKIMKQLSIYPNPAENQITVSFSLDHAQEVSMDLLDVSGRRIQKFMPIRGHAGMQSVSLQVEYLENGFYVLELGIGQQKEHHKLVIRR